ncbi:MAG: hypothetical protein ICV87_14755 [Gemmatimonadetes bacterium]|nr:hypothetical protein [Gemmatimonadota bacterium]
MHQPLRYGAREWDQGVGLLPVRAHWYDPQTGRFVSEDPIGLVGGINPYAYGGARRSKATIRAARFRRLAPGPEGVVILRARDAVV